MTCFCKLLISKIIHLYICIWNWPTFSIRFVYIHLFCDLKKMNQKKFVKSRQWLHESSMKSYRENWKCWQVPLYFEENRKQNFVKMQLWKKRDKSGPAFLSTSLLGFWRSVICCICQKFKCFRLLGILPKWESGLAGLQLCSWQKIFSFSRPA